MTTKPATEPAKTSQTPQVAEATPDTETIKSTPDASPSELTQMELTTQMDSSTQIYEKILTTLDDSFSTRKVRTETVKSLTEQDTNNADITIPGATSTGGRKQLECGNFLMREQGINQINTRYITIALLDPISDSPQSRKHSCV